MHKTIKTRSGREVIVPTPEENAAINAGIAADPDTYELGAGGVHPAASCGPSARSRQAPNAQHAHRP